MPELPEVETTRRGIERHLRGRRVLELRVRERRLRQPLPRLLERALPGQVIREVARRGKYLLLRTDAGAVLIHLGMSGSLRIVAPELPAQKHDHVDILCTDDVCLRFRDPRRFGLMLWVEGDPEGHELLRGIGPEPLDAGFSGASLYTVAQGRRVAVKLFIMDAGIVAGVGNIYANEALFRAGIHPLRPSGRVSAARYMDLANAIRAVLNEAIDQGGTTLRDYYHGTGEPGYFRIRLAVYGREGEPCVRCGAPVRCIRQGQRATYYCARCQR
ncbi:MAG: bifunctional DNA-formamidopyrimidine glycosylase/DNA-(apurinic or apyrimidinic site) lyase [Gammaproteobacteria bacterium]|nr:bifunctional DNA-formamidopyrimidine glycosylase/DNA-(apurinic or apyrimidinic site) lyase [Gammaproteobacteria bacterium]